MKVGLPIAGIASRIKRYWITKSVKLLVSLAILVCIIALAFFLVTRHSKPANNTTQVKIQPAATASQWENESKTSVDNLLNQGDIPTYLAAQRNLATQYIEAKDYTNADRIMGEVFSKVPSNEIDSATYYVMVELEQGKGDTVQLKHYLQLLISQLNNEGDSRDAAVEQGVLNNVK